MNNKEVDLVLSGSGVRLGCHYGAVLALKKKSVKIIRMAGVSGGSIIAAAYACSYPFEDVWHLLKHMKFNELICDGRGSSYLRLLFKHGLYKGNKFEKFVDKNITRGAKLKDYPNLNILATDLDDRSHVKLNWEEYGEMKISEAVRMSMSAPVYWVPKYLNIHNKEHTIVDGGISNNYPIDFFNDNLRPTIGVNLYIIKNKVVRPKIVNYFRNILSTMFESIEMEHIEDAYWARTIKIDTGDIRSFDLDITPEQVDWCIKQGYQKTLEVFESKIERRLFNG